MRTALIHDWLVTIGGAERALLDMLQVVPDAELFTICDFLTPPNRARFGGRSIHTTFIQKCPFAKSRYRDYLPLMPLAIEQLDVSQFELVISSSTAVAKGVLTGPDQLHIAYVNSPMRYAWDLSHQYLYTPRFRRWPLGWAARACLHYLRLWDVRTALGVDVFVANSHFIARRIQKVYRRDSVVVYPPVDVAAFELQSEKDDYYVTVARAVPYKRLDLMCDAFARMPRRKLIVIGDGPDLPALKRRAIPNVTLLGHQPPEAMRQAVQNARAFVFAAVEDFGIAPVEAQACGTPVIAFGRGGTSETVLDGKTGVLYYDQSPEALMQAIEVFERNRETFDPAEIREHSLRFSRERFLKEFAEVIEHSVQSRPGRPGPRLPHAGAGTPHHIVTSQAEQGLPHVTRSR